METKTPSNSSVQACQNCRQNFTIDENDAIFYAKMEVPHPTWCPDCRMMRRLSFVNAWSISFRNCDKCGIKTMSAFRPDFPGIVYCQQCWWGDTWDGTEYAMEYNPNRNFLEQWKELQMKTPQCALETTYLNLKNSEYCNSVGFLKNCYLTFWADYCDDTYYSSILNEVKDCCDTLRMNKSELCYESVGLGNCSRVHFSDTCDDCNDVWFSRNCYGCINCVGCVNLRGESYCIFNQKYSREEYFEKLKELELDTRDGIEKMKQTVSEFFLQFPRREYTGNAQNLNVTGEYVFESKNAKDSYMCVNTEDSRYCQFISVPSAKDCMDYSGWGDTASEMYECASVGQGASNCKLSYHCFPDSLGLEYCTWNIGGKYNFGCANLKRKKYCILNKEYSKEEYETLRVQIIEDMKNTPYIDRVGRIFSYGEFFPPEFSLFPYNDTNAHRFIPKTKEEALAYGFNWQDKLESSHASTIAGNDLPQTVEEVTSEILNEIIGCDNCGKGFKIVSGELTLLQKMKIPLPSQCPKCRENKRFEKCNLPKLYNRSCTKCEDLIVTAFPPEKPDIVYCVKCYQQEFV